MQRSSIILMAMTAFGLSSGRRIIFRKDGDWQKIASFPFSFPRDLFAFSRPTARAMRSDKCNIFVNRTGRILGIRAGWVYAINDKAISPLFSIQGDCVLHGSITEDQEGNIYFGEYFMNPERAPGSHLEGVCRPIPMGRCS